LDDGVIFLIASVLSIGGFASLVTYILWFGPFENVENVENEKGDDDDE